MFYQHRADPDVSAEEVVSTIAELMTSAQVALGWLLQKAPWIVPIPGTTKLSHLEENLHTLDFHLAPEEWRELETAVAAIPVVGDRYNAELQRQVGADLLANI